MYFFKNIPHYSRGQIRQTEYAETITMEGSTCNVKFMIPGAEVTFFLLCLEFIVPLENFSLIWKRAEVHMLDSGHISHIVNMNYFIFKIYLRAFWIEK